MFPPAAQAGLFLLLADILLLPEEELASGDAVTFRAVAIAGGDVAFLPDNFPWASEVNVKGRAVGDRDLSVLDLEAAAGVITAGGGDGDDDDDDDACAPPRR